MEIKALSIPIWQEHAHFIAPRNVISDFRQIAFCVLSLFWWPSLKPRKENHKFPGTFDLDLEFQGVQPYTVASRAGGTFLHYFLPLSRVGLGETSLPFPLRGPLTLLGVRRQNPF